MGSVLCLTYHTSVWFALCHARRGGRSLVVVLARAPVHLRYPPGESEQKACAFHAHFVGRLSVCSPLHAVVEPEPQPFNQKAVQQRSAGRTPALHSLAAVPQNQTCAYFRRRNTSKAATPKPASAAADGSGICNTQARVYLVVPPSGDHTPVPVTIGSRVRGSTPTL